MSIIFGARETVLELRMEAHVYRDNESLAKLQLPERVWAIAIDDSLVQLKVLSALCRKLHISVERTALLGKNREEIEQCADRIIQLMADAPDCRFLLLVDENLDVTEGTALVHTISGSHMVSSLRERLDQQDEARVLAIMRSANDSQHDIALYLQHAHGFIGKNVSGNSFVSALLPLWIARFGADTLERVA